MSRVLIFILVVGIVLVLGWRWALSSDSTQWSLYQLRVKSDLASAKSQDEVLEGIALHACQTSDCLMVRAAGREFIVGAGQGAAEDFAQQGLLTGKLDGVLLTELTGDRISGLPVLRNKTHEAGRRSPLTVYGPVGTDRVVEGVNAMLESADAERSVMFQGALPFAAAPLMEGARDDDALSTVIFDSGVLQITQFVVSDSLVGADVLYRFDQDDISLIVGGCRARLEDVRLAFRREESVSHHVVLPVASQRQLEAKREALLDLGLSQQARFTMQASEVCLSAPAAFNLEKVLNGATLTPLPLYPIPKTSLNRRIWKQELEAAELGVESATPQTDTPLLLVK